MTGCKPDQPAGQDEPMIALGRRYCDLLLQRARFEPRSEARPWQVQAVVHIQKTIGPAAPVSPQTPPDPMPVVFETTSSRPAANRIAPPPSIGPNRRGPIPKNPAQWVTGKDYPPDAKRAGLEGTVGFALDVGADGIPSRCTVTRSSNAPVLDAATCQLLMARARFTGAVNQAGALAASTYSATIRWALPMDYLPEEMQEAKPNGS